MYIIDMIPKVEREANSWPWRIVAISNTDKSEHSEVYKYLNSLSESERDKVNAVLHLASEMGPENIPSTLRHTMDVNNRFLFEFRKGRHRIAWFYDEGKLVVCSGGFLKRGQTTPEPEQRKALKAYNEYFESKELNKIKELDS